MIARRRVGSERVKRLAGQREERFAERFALSGMRMDERGDVFGVRFPPDGELAFGDEFPHAIAHEVRAKDGPVLGVHRPTR